MAPVTHLVLLQFKPDISDDQLEETNRRFHALAQESKRDGRPYIKSIRGGKDMSIEGLAQGNQVRVPSLASCAPKLTGCAGQMAFVVEFASTDDRDFYCRECEVHGVR